MVDMQAIGQVDVSTMHCILYTYNQFVALTFARVSVCVQFFVSQPL